MCTSEGQKRGVLEVEFQVLVSSLIGVVGPKLSSFQENSKHSQARSLAPGMSSSPPNPGSPPGYLSPCNTSCPRTQCVD